MPKRSPAGFIEDLDFEALYRDDHRGKASVFRCALQAIGIDLDINAVRTDELGRITSPVWHLHARRLPDDKVSSGAATSTQHTEAGGTK